MIGEDVKLGENVKIPYPELVNLYGCEIGEGVFIGPFVEIQKGAKIGAKSRISSHSFICEGVEIGEGCFVAHGVMFVNDKFTERREEWILRRTHVGDNVRIGSNSTILPVGIAKNTIIGAGSVVTKNVREGMTVAGNPAKEIFKKKEIPEIFEKKVPFVDLKKQYASIEGEIKQELNWVLQNTSFILGEKVSNFEKDFASFCRKDYSIAVNSGTSSLHLALLAKGIKPGDEVITVSNTFIATTEAISYVGAKPVLVEVGADYLIDPNKIEQAITEKTKAIIPVHLYGQSCNMGRIIEIAQRYNLEIIEDCCQSHGAEYEGKRVPIADTGCFSFYPGKNLGAYGEGGMVVTNNEGIAKKIKILRDHGQGKKYYHDYIGYNYRMDGFQGAVLGVKLGHLLNWIEKRRKNAHLYSQLLREIPEVALPIENPNSKHVYHLYVIRVKERERLMEFLKLKGIDTGIHYPIPIHLQKAYDFLGFREGDYQITERYSKEILSLPMFPELTEEQIKYVADSIKEFYQERFK